MKILILGASGLVGGALFRCLSEQHEVYGTYHKNKPDETGACFLPFDISDLDSLDTVLDTVKPQLVVSSLTGNFAHQLAVHRHVADYLRDTEGRCIFISSANVFDGAPDTAHTEKDAPYPVSAYGKYKYECEQLLQKALGDRCLIVRLPKILSADSLLELEREAESDLPVYTNFYISVQTAERVAQAVCYYIGSTKHGIAHITSTDTISYENMVIRLMNQQNKRLVYKTDALTADSYKQALGCENTVLVRCNMDGNFYLVLESADDDLPSHITGTCESIINIL